MLLCRPASFFWEIKRLRLLLQQKRQVKIELWVKCFAIVSYGHLVDYAKKLHQTACCSCSTSIYAHLKQSNHWFVASSLLLPLLSSFCLSVVSISVKHIPGLLSLLIFCVFLFSDCLDCYKPSIFKWKVLVRQDCRLILIHWKTVFIYVFHYSLSWLTR